LQDTWDCCKAAPAAGCPNAILPLVPRSAAFGSFSTFSTSTTTISTIAVMPGNRTLPGLGSDNGLLGEFHLGLGCAQARGG
jgi:hypothetical protein